MSWRPHLYLQFEQERTRPCRELVARVPLPAPVDIVDLGCGPGNSTAVLGERWPQASITGLDSSEEMLAAARAAYPQFTWAKADIMDWSTAESQYDIVLSNAALQWAPDHETLYPRLMDHVRPGGFLAIQVPANIHAPAHRVMRELAASAAWRDRFPSSGVREWHVHQPSFYYNVLASYVSRIDLWQTEYIQIVPGVESLGEWYRASGLRPFIHALKSEAERESFFDEYVEALRPEYSPQADGRVLFPFQRLFLVAQR